MKKFIFLFSLLTIFAACDKVECPYVEEPTAPGTDSTSFIGTEIIVTNIDPANATESTIQNIFLEDYTGFKCTNCPEAHEVADDLRGIYGEQLNVMSLHVSEAFAEPNAGAVFPEPFSQDFRTEDGEIYLSQFGIFALPSGVINRKKIDDFFPVAFEAWEANVDELSLLSSPIKLEIQNASFANDTLDINCSFEILEDLTGDYYFTINLVENEVVSAQDNAGTVILDYVQKDVFRGTLNGTYGEIVSSDPQDLELHTVEGHYYLPGTLLNPDVPNPDIEIGDCHVIIYIYQQDLDNNVFEIIQVGHKDLTI